MPPSPYTGRFAPSPTGDLHFGSLVAAVGSYLQARRQGGRWHVRIEDIDPPREVPGSAEGILRDLGRLGMNPDGDVVRQSTRRDAFDEALGRLADTGWVFPCACTRSELPDGPYPGTCREGLPPGKKGRSLRVRVRDEVIRFQDAIQGEQEENLAATSGDFIVRRGDGLVAYQLAVVVDDAWQGVTEVVRGADLMNSTPRQIHLQRLLGLPTPRYLHLPVVKDSSGRKLGKRFGSDPVASRPAVDALGDALAFLGHPPPRHDSLEARWDWARARWNERRIPPAAPADFGLGKQGVYSPARPPRPE